MKFLTLTVMCWLALCVPAMAQTAPLKVVASFSILGDMVHEVAGDAIELKVLVGPNGDAHVYEPTPADAKSLAAADIIVVNGIGFEGWLDRLIVSSGTKGKVVVATTGITPYSFDKEGLTHDPHAWQSLNNARFYVTNIRNALVEADAAHADLYKANAKRYLEQLTDLDRWVRTEIAKIPPIKRKVMTSHDAFQYFARSYDITFIAPLGMSTESEASAGDIARLIDQINEQRVMAVFMENIADSRLIMQLQQENRAYAGGVLYSDALSTAEGPASTYVAMFTHNVGEMLKGMKYN